jgi:hypothetical protein
LFYQARLFNHGIIIISFTKYSLSILFSLILFFPAFVEAGAAKNLVLNCLPAFFCGAKSSINAPGVAYKSSWNSFSIFLSKDYRPL